MKLQGVYRGFHDSVVVKIPASGCGGCEFKSH